MKNTKNTKKMNMKNFVFFVKPFVLFVLKS